MKQAGSVDQAGRRLIFFAQPVSTLLPLLILSSLSCTGSYIEFAERLVLPQYASLKLEQIQEHHRRDGFEVG